MDHLGFEDATLPPLNGLCYVHPQLPTATLIACSRTCTKNVPKTSTKEMCPQDVCCAKQDLGWREVASVLRGPFPPGTPTATFPGLTTPRCIFRDLCQYENIIILNLPATEKLKHLLLSANRTESSLDVGDPVRFSGNYDPRVIVALSAWIWHTAADI